MGLSLSPLAAAIANNEGYGTPEAVTINAYNNPGSITDSSGSLIQYQSLEDGAAALENQVNKMVYGGSSVYDPSMTLDQAAPIYTNNGSNAAQNWASSLGVPTSTTLGDLQSLQEGGSKSDDTGSSEDINDNTNSQTWWELLAQKLLGNTGALSPNFMVNVVFIVLGIIVILVGLFSFKNDGDVIETIQQGAGKVRDAASAAAVA